MVFNDNDLFESLNLFADLSHLEEKAAFGSSWGTWCVLVQMDGEGLKCKGHKYVNIKKKNLLTDQISR